MKNVQTLTFRKFKINDSLGQFHKFKEPYEIEVKAVKPHANQSLMQVKACILQDVLGNELDFQRVPVPENIQIGDKATIDGKPCEGSYILGDGSEWQFVAGVLKKIIPPSEPTAGSIMSKIVNLKKYFETIKTEFQ
ncbi:MAG: hypothetical protein R6W78_10450 [Bacteroidales bacterium]